MDDAPAELRATVLAMKKADKNIKKNINNAMRQEFNPIWKNELAGAVLQPTDKMLLKGARIAAGNPPALIAASSRARFGRALKPIEHWHLAEYGDSGRKISKYERTSKTGSHTVKRHTMTGWPAPYKKGRILDPVTGRIIPRIASYWIQSTIRAYLDALDQKG